MRKYLLLIFVLIFVTIGLILYLPYEKQTSEMHEYKRTEEVEKDTAVIEFKEDIIRTMPTGPEIEIVPYYKVEEKPQHTRFQEERSEIAKKYGIECDVVVKALVDTNGCVIETKILKTSGYEVMDNEALRIAEKFKFTPARARPKSPRVWVVLPIKFRIDE